ncbi:MAG: hypothetical protein ACI4JM_01250 [Oscillospiraceae bacterium]
MYNNNEYLEQAEKVSDYAKHRAEMKRIKKCADMAFWINVPIIAAELSGVLLSLISFDIANFGIASLFTAFLIAFLTFMATYKKSKIASFTILALYIMISAQFVLLAVLTVPAIVIYTVFIKSLFDEDKLKKLEGYPLFDEKINTYNLLYGTESVDFTSMTYDNPEKDNIDTISFDNSYIDKSNSSVNCEMEELSLPDIRGD